MINSRQVLLMLLALFPLGAVAPGQALTSLNLLAPATTEADTKADAELLTWTAFEPIVPSESSSGSQPLTPNADVTQANVTQPEFNDPYRRVVEQTKAMVTDSQARDLAAEQGLSILNVTWEDTGRFKNSSVGPNISDLTIQVQTYDPERDQYDLHLMPVIRYPNFADKSADIPLDRLSVLVGNQNGTDLEKVSLRSLLGNLRDYLHEPDSWQGSETSLLAERDSHVLVSAQAAFLPIPAEGKAEFNPVLFNYQSYAEHPAVLTILATREGTSITIIDNVRDGFDAGMTWGQRLFFNQNGERASLTAERISDFQAQLEVEQPDAIVPDLEALEAQGLNLVLVIQVPLKQPPPPRRSAWFGDGVGLMVPTAPAMESQAAFSDVETAVIGHGEVEGPFTEIDNLAIERDPRFPIRATVQFYKGTSNGVVNRNDLQAIHNQIEQVYQDADYVGSLVIDGETDRPTEYDGDKQEPADWWLDFWQRHEANTGQSKQAAWLMLRRLLNLE